MNNYIDGTIEEEEQGETTLLLACQEEVEDPQNIWFLDFEASNHVW